MDKSRSFLAIPISPNSPRAERRPRCFGSVLGAECTVFRFAPGHPTRRVTFSRTPPGHSCQRQFLSPMDHYPISPSILDNCLDRSKYPPIPSLPTSRLRKLATSAPALCERPTRLGRSAASSAHPARTPKRCSHTLRGDLPESGQLGKLLGPGWSFRSALVERVRRSTLSDRQVALPTPHFAWPPPRSHRPG